MNHPRLHGSFFLGGYNFEVFDEATIGGVSPHGFTMGPGTPKSIRISAPIMVDAGEKNAY
jgi:hypothetical protein